jgi:hypothetical protein
MDRLSTTMGGWDVPGSALAGWGNGEAQREVGLELA